MLFMMATYFRVLLLENLAVLTKGFLKVFPLTRLLVHVPFFKKMASLVNTVVGKHRASSKLDITSSEGGHLGASVDVIKDASEGG